MKKTPKIVTVVQARLASTRFPHKVMMSLWGKPLLLRMLERVNASYLTDIVVVATTDKAEDDLIEKICKKNNLLCFRGHETDLLDRHYQAALYYNAEAVVKIPSDCPLIDPSVINKVISHYIKNYPRFDYVSNLHPATYPDGNDIEIMSFRALEFAWKNASKVYEREHTTPFIWDNNNQFTIENVNWETGLDYSMTHRWTIDYEEDYLFIKAVYNELFEQNKLFNLYDILNLVETKPHIKKINQKYAGINWYRHHLNELASIKPSQTRLVNHDGSKIF